MTHKHCPECDAVTLHCPTVYTEGGKKVSKVGPQRGEGRCCQCGQPVRTSATAKNTAKIRGKIMTFIGARP